MTGPLFDSMTVREVATLCGVHAQTVRAWIKGHRIHPAGDRGPHGRYLIRREEAEDMALSKGRIKPRYRTGDRVIYTDPYDQDSRLAIISTYRPSMGYLIDLGLRLKWVPEHDLMPARSDS